ncbi:hypothetical protein MN608_10603 [Microdochium nivale]|nr:hypothetical protein MN608_10603 [Microdochium nivale]
MEQDVQKKNNPERADRCSACSKTQRCIGRAHTEVLIQAGRHLQPEGHAALDDDNDDDDDGPRFRILCSVGGGGQRVASYRLAEARSIFFFSVGPRDPQSHVRAS